MMNRLIVSEFIAVSPFTTSCVKEEKSSSNIGGGSQWAALDGKRVIVHGYIEVDALDYPNFVEKRSTPTRDRITESVDLVPNDVHVEKKLIEFGGRGVVVDGKFHVYGTNEVRLGNLVSMYGKVDDGTASIDDCGVVAYPRE
jgi:hypothetical protein